MRLFPYAWTAGKLLYVQEDTVFRQLRGLGTRAGRAPLWAESLDLEQVPETSVLGLMTRPDETIEFARDRVSFRNGKLMRYRGS